MAGRPKKITGAANVRKDATADYLASIADGPIPGAVDPGTTELAYDYDNMTFQGEVVDRLAGDYEFYRASAKGGGKSIERAKREGYVALKPDADIRLKGCHDGENDVYMIRKRERGDQERARLRAMIERRNAVARKAPPGFAGSRITENRGEVGQEYVTVNR